MQLRTMLGTLVLATISSSTTSAQLIQPTSQTRAVTVSAFVEDRGGTDEAFDSLSATDFDPFAGSTSVTAQVLTGSAVGGATLESEILGTSISAAGTAFATSVALGLGTVAESDGASVMSLSFTLTCDANFVLQGVVSAIDNGSANLVFNGTSYLASGPSRQHAIDASGTLAAGDHTIVMSANGEAFASSFGTLNGSAEFRMDLELSAVFPSFCDGVDGALDECPCANPGAPDSGCDIAQGTGGVSLRVLSQTTSPNGATLQGTGYSRNGAPTAIVLRSTGLDPEFAVAFGDGVRCLDATPLVRLSVDAPLRGVGQPSVHTIGHGVDAGAGTFYYQLWFRSDPSSFCDPSAAFNLSNGRSLTW